MSMEEQLQDNTTSIETAVTAMEKEIAAIKIMSSLRGA